MGFSVPPANGQPPTVWAVNSLLRDDLSLVTWVGCDKSCWPISGGLAPILGAQDGASMTSIKGLMGSAKHLDKEGARQDGSDWVDAVWDPSELDLGITLGSNTPAGLRAVNRRWMDSWDLKLTGQLHWFSSGMGEWWLPLRLFKEPSDQLKYGPASMTKVDYQWVARSDLPLWLSFDSTSQQTATGATTLADPAGQNAPGFLPLWNRGDQDGWPRYIVQGPLTSITIGNNGGTGSVSYGPLAAGQSVLVTTQPRKRSITDMVTGVDTYPLLVGRFDQSVPRYTAVQIPVSVTGAVAGQTSIVASLTPYRKWPE